MSDFIKEKKENSVEILRNLKIENNEDELLRIFADIDEVNGNKNKDELERIKKDGIEEKSLYDFSNILEKLEFNSSNYNKLTNIILKLDNINNLEDEIPDVLVKSYNTESEFTGNNITVSQLFRKSLISKNVITKERECLLISANQAEQNHAKIKENSPYCYINCPPTDKNPEWHKEKYYHISSVENKEILKDVDKELYEKPKVINQKAKLENLKIGDSIPDFALITQNGLKVYKEMKITAHDIGQKTFTFSDGEKSISIPEDTVKELIKKESRGEIIHKDSPIYESLPETQYKIFFEIRNPNDAENFRHNLAVKCRKDANSPIDSIYLAKQLIDKMNKTEKEKTKKMLLSLAKENKWENKTINGVIMDIYNAAVKEVPLNENWILQNRPSKDHIARNFYDNLSIKGEKVDKDSPLKIGESIENITIKTKNPFDNSFEKHSYDLKVISASKEANKITLMDKNNSFIEVPRDTFLSQYNRKIHKEIKQKSQNTNSIELS